MAFENNSTFPPRFRNGPARLRKGRFPDEKIIASGTHIIRRHSYGAGPHGGSLEGFAVESGTRDHRLTGCKRLLAVGRSVRENGGAGFDSWRWSSVKSDAKTTRLTRRQMLGRTGQAALGSVVLTPLIQGAILSCASAAETGLKGVAGIDRVTILPGKTYLRGWAGYGDPPRSNQNRGRQDTPPRALDGPAHTAMWTKDSGPGEVKFDDAKADRKV